jgi:predicted oxidoreductase
MTFRIAASGVDVEEVMRQVRRRIQEKKQGVLTDAEVEEIAGHRLEPVLEAHDLKSGLLAELLGDTGRWNFSFDPEAIYRSSRGGVGGPLERVRRLLRPIQKLFWNPTPMISAISRQSDLNQAYVHLLHNLVLEVTRLNLEVQELKNRALQLQGRLEAQARREKALESMVVFREGEGKG